MGLFDFFKRKQKSPSAEQTPPEPRLTEQDIFTDPRYLALWVNKYFLENYPLEKNYELVTDDETRKSLGITFAQRERCAREYSVLRIAGVSWFIKCAYDDTFWLTFSRDIAAPLTRQIFGPEWQQHIDETAEALDRYVAFMANDQVAECGQFYLTRLYDDNDKFLRIKIAGVGALAQTRSLAPSRLWKTHTMSLRQNSPLARTHA